MTILERVKMLCKEKGIKLYELEEMLELGRGGASKWNKYIPNSQNMNALSNYFNVSVDYLLGKSEFRNQDEMFKKWDADFAEKINDEFILIEMISKNYGEDAARLLEYFKLLNQKGKDHALGDLADLTEQDKYIM